MSITILPVPGYPRLQVIGDIEAILHVPFDDDDRFLVGVSDGTLLVGTYDEQPIMNRSTGTAPRCMSSATRPAMPPV